MVMKRKKMKKKSGKKRKRVSAGKKRCGVCFSDIITRS